MTCSGGPARCNIHRLRRGHVPDRQSWRKAQSAARGNCCLQPGTALRRFPASVASVSRRSLPRDDVKKPSPTGRQMPSPAHFGPISSPAAVKSDTSGTAGRQRHSGSAASAAQEAGLSASRRGQRWSGGQQRGAARRFTEKSVAIPPSVGIIRGTRVMRLKSRRASRSSPLECIDVPTLPRVRRVECDPGGACRPAGRSSRTEEPKPVDPAMADAGKSLFLHEFTPNDPLWRRGRTRPGVQRQESCCRLSPAGRPGGQRREGRECPGVSRTGGDLRHRHTQVGTSGRVPTPPRRARTTARATRS